MAVIEKKMLLFGGTSNPAFTEDVAEILGCKIGNLDLKKFENGEIYARYHESVRGADVFLIQSIAETEHSSINDSLMELLVMADAAVRASARTVTAVITHYAYARQDKKSAAREPITAKLVANLLEVAGVDRIITVDLHQGQVQGFFDIPVNHLTALPLFADEFNSMGLDKDNLVVVSPDVGRAKAAKKLSSLLDCSLGIMHKDRPKHGEAEITTVIGDVEGKTCIINDDMIDTAGTIIAGAKALLKEGADKIYLSATHGLLSGPAYDRIMDAPIEQLIITDTVPVPAEKLGAKIKTISVAPTVARAIRNVFEEKSVSEIFDPDFQL